MKELKQKILCLFLVFTLISTFLIAEDKPNNGSDTSILPIPNKYNWNSVKDWKQAREILQHDLQVMSKYQEQKQSKTSNLLKSLVVPGWGHIAAGEYIKGEILIGLELFVAGSAFYFYDKSSDYYSKYKNANNVQDISQFYTDANTAYQNSQVFWSLFTIIWGYSALDSFRATAEHNTRLWQKLSFEYKGKTLEIAPFELNIRF